ncbi:MAG: hypothetical protein FWB90_04605 [Fibromonadales bacterium]|nr:hypothetical protein [Fibromonadales bacterium]
MRIIYKLLIDTERKDLPSNPSVGFQNGVYHFSTAPSNDFYDCLEGNSFSNISQQNLIAKGGEFSQMEDVSVKIVSNNIMTHISQNEIELLGRKASMLAEINGLEKSIFEKMLITSYPQIDSISFEINLSDSTLANAGQVNLKVPQGFGGNSQLETSYGRRCLLKAYKQDSLPKSASQGIKSNLASYHKIPTPELEQYAQDPQKDELLITRNGQPAFAKNFTVYQVLNAGTGELAKMLVSDAIDRRSPEISNLEGGSIEICAGKSKGNSFRVTKVDDIANTSQIFTVPVDVIFSLNSLRFSIPSGLAGRESISSGTLYQTVASSTTERQMQIGDNKITATLEYWPAPAEGTIKIELRDRFGEILFSAEATIRRAYATSKITVSVQFHSSRELGTNTYRIITLDKPVDAGEILTESEVNFNYLREMPGVIGKYSLAYPGGVAKAVERAITHSLKVDSQNANIPDDISVFRCVDKSIKYAVPHLPNIEISPDYGKPNAKIINDDGSLSDVRLVFNTIESNANRTIIEFPISHDGKTTVTESAQHSPRWRTINSQTALWSKRTPPETVTLFPNEGDIVTEDYEQRERFEHSIRVEMKSGDPGIMALQTTIYWRIDDLDSRGGYKIKPRFSFWMDIRCSISARAILVDDAGNAIATKNYLDDRTGYGPNIKISLTRGKYSSEGPDADAQRLMEELRNIFAFDYDSSAKYIYLQLLFEFPLGGLSQRGILCLSALPVLCEREIDIDKILIIGNHVYTGDASEYGPIKETERLCEDYGINVDESSFDNANENIQNEIGLSSGSRDEQSSFILLKHGDKFANKLAEICRATNVSMYTDGSKLYARHFQSAQMEWTIKPKDVIKSSFRIRPTDADSIATEWSFEAYTWDGLRTFAMSTVTEDLSQEWPPAGESFNAALYLPEYMSIGGFGASNFSEIDITKLRIGYAYRANISEGWCEVYCVLVDLRTSKSGTSTSPYRHVSAQALFTITEYITRPNGSRTSSALEITPLKQNSYWSEMIGGSMNVGFSSASTLSRISKEAFTKTRRKATLDERYSKHKIAAFGADRFWLQSFLLTASHNAFIKNVMSFSVPINLLQEGCLASLLLKRIKLGFGKFTNRPIEAWITSYVFAPAEDVVQIECINSEPRQENLWFNENLLENQLTINEGESTQDYYQENQ